MPTTHTYMPRTIQVWISLSLTSVPTLWSHRSRERPPLNQLLNRTNHLAVATSLQCTENDSRENINNCSSSSNSRRVTFSTIRALTCTSTRIPTLIYPPSELISRSFSPEITTSLSYLYIWEKRKSLSWGDSYGKSCSSLTWPSWRTSTWNWPAMTTIWPATSNIHIWQQFCWGIEWVYHTRICTDIISVNVLDTLRNL